MKHWRTWLFFAAIILLVIAGILFFPARKKTAGAIIIPSTQSTNWQAPDSNLIPLDAAGNLIRYGKELIARTSVYLGPKGNVAHLTNGMNCQNCHLNAGQQVFGNPFSAVASTYPKYRVRSGRVESVAYRIKECMERSLNGQFPDSASTEIRAMVAYINWVGKEVPKGVKPTGADTEELPFLNRAADPVQGRVIYAVHCQRCHGVKGEGLMAPDSTYYVFPPLWGKDSYNVSAGMYRLSKLAGFIKNNMPLGVTWQKPQLSKEEAWDVAAYVNSQFRQERWFKYDWPDIATKPVDYPFKPYTDTFSEAQHKYGPFDPIKQDKEKKTGTASKTKQ